MIRKASILGISLLLAGAAVASAQEKKPLSPAGTAAMGSFFAGCVATVFIAAMGAPGGGGRRAVDGRAVVGVA